VTAAGNSTITTEGSGRMSPLKEGFTNYRKVQLWYPVASLAVLCGTLCTPFSPLVSRSIVLSLLEAVIDGEHDRLRARPHTKLVEKIRNVITNSLFADRQTVGNLCVTQAF
jgi:hypothetical protein